ncbi:hypothetical protein ACOMHN_038669 [Nucella lapillus]
MVDESSHRMVLPGFIGRLLQRLETDHGWVGETPDRVEGLSSPLFGIISPCLKLSTSSAPSFNRALEDGFGQRIVAIRMANPSHNSAPFSLPVEPAWLKAPGLCL